jgi:hypothetical protein
MVEEAVARFGIPVKLIGLAVLLEFLLVLIHLFGRGVPVLLAEDAQERA